MENPITTLRGTETVRWLAAIALLGSVAYTQAESPRSQKVLADVDPPALESIEDTTNIEVIPPSDFRQAGASIAFLAAAASAIAGRPRYR